MSRNRSQNNNEGWFGTAREKAGATEMQHLESQNNDELGSLAEQVAMLKGLTLDIDAEVKSQNSFLEKMGDGFSSVGDVLASTMKSLDAMTQRGTAKFGLFVATSVVLLLMGLWWASTRLSAGAAIADAPTP